MDLYQALNSRRSVRAYKPDPVPTEVLRRIFEQAQQAPSWCNIQPWRVWLTSGDKTAALKAAMIQAAGEGPPAPDYEFPTFYPEPYQAHRRACGGALYGAMGIERGDKEGRRGAWMRNYEAFDAPHVAIVGFDKRFALYAALDVGCWLQSLLLAATSEGVSTCAMSSLASFPNAIRPLLGIDEEIGVFFGITLGYEDSNMRANNCRMDRDSVDANIKFLG